HSSTGNEGILAMATASRARNTAPRDFLVLVIARAGGGRIELAGVDVAAGTWLRVADENGDRSFSSGILRLADGTDVQLLDTVRVPEIVRAPQPPFVEAARFGAEAIGARVGHIEERAISRTLAEIAVPHLDTLLPLGKRVLTPKDFLPGGRQRSIA